MGEKTIQELIANPKVDMKLRAGVAAKIYGMAVAAAFRNGTLMEDGYENNTEVNQQWDHLRTQIVHGKGCGGLDVKDADWTKTGTD